MATVIRKYRHTDVAMLTSLSTIVENAIKNKAALLAKRATWADPFLPNLKTRIDTVIQANLGVDSAKELRQVTQVLVAVQRTVIDKLGLFKVQIEQDLKKTPFYNLFDSPMNIHLNITS